MKKEQIVGKTQSIIRDFKVQSFAIKGFSLTFLGLLIQPYYETPNLSIAVVYIIAITVFWYLDSFYLMMENIYRDIEKKAEGNEVDENFSLNYKEHEDCRKRNPICKYMFSKTILPLYLVQYSLVIVIYIIN